MDNISLPLLCLVTCTVALIAYCITNYLKLRPMPGPFLASLTPLWRFYHHRNGTLRHRLISLHQTYGPIVRFSPTALSIRDAAAIQTIYASTGAHSFKINESYEPLLGIDPVTKRDVRSLVTMGEDDHAKVRRAVAGAFAPNSVSEMEGVIDETVTELLGVLGEIVEVVEGEDKGVVDLSRLFLWYSLDNATRMVFGEVGGCLKADEDVQGLGEMIRERFAHWGAWSSLPSVERALYRNPLSLRLRNTQPASFIRNAAARITERLSNPHNENSAPDLLDKLIQAREKYPDVMNAKGTTGIIMSTISGASDTTASTLTGILYYLIQHPPILKKLDAELQDAKLTTPIPKYEELKKLRYLDAVIKESMRLFSLLNSPMERTVPPSGIVIASTPIPAGTSIGILPAAMHMDPAIFGEDVDSFHPERWLDDDAEAVRKMDAAFLGFSRGKRVCLGQHIAWMQLRKVVVVCVQGFKWEFVREEQELEAEYQSMIAVMKPLVVRVRRR